MEEQNQKKVAVQTILIKQEEGMVVTYIDEMLNVEQPLIPHMLKLKVVEICQSRLIVSRMKFLKNHGSIGLKKGTPT